RYSFTTAGFNEYSQAELGVLFQKQDIANWSGGGPAWEWVVVTFDEISQGDVVDVDDDGFEEYVMLLDRTAGRLGVLDYQEGDINFSEPLFPDGRAKGGLQDDYTKRFQVLGGSSFSRQEDAGGITTTDSVNVLETINRTILVESGYRDAHGNGYADGMYPINDELETQRTSTWSTPH
ncbi:hypothetical protein ACFL1I_07830, partial [Candidatus Omnitrophota bacterium]